MNFTRLTYCTDNYTGKIVDFDGGTGAKENIEQHGLIIGEKITLKPRKNGIGKIIVLHKNKEISLGHELASKILLECEKIPTVTLNNVKVGDIAEVTKMGAKGDVRFRLLDMGLVKGVEIKVIRIAPLGDPIELLINGFNLSLRIDEAKSIEVKITEIIKSRNNGKKRWGMF